MKVILLQTVPKIGKEGTVAVQSIRSDGEIHVAVSDNGPGIPEELQRKVFDPFFTTKQSGKGTGLGLWISYSIIEKMGGTITLNSKPGAGTTFTVKIPIVVPQKK